MLGQAEPEAPVTSSVTAEQLTEYDTLTPAQKMVIDHALNLTTMNLGYLYGSADPARGGMDCSGTIQHLLQKQAQLSGVPRQANHFYRWVWKDSVFHAVNSTQADGFEWKHLTPGDLLFWSGTYEIDRDPPVTHVMLYLGTLKESGKRVMFGASSGRYYGREPQHGVSVFNFDLPREGSTSRFLGYGSIPGLDASAGAVELEAQAETGAEAKIDATETELETD